MNKSLDIDWLVALADRLRAAGVKDFSYAATDGHMSLSLTPAAPSTPATQTTTAPAEVKPVLTAVQKLEAELLPEE